MLKIIIIVIARINPNPVYGNNFFNMGSVRKMQINNVKEVSILKNLIFQH